MKILVVLTSHDKLGDTGEKTGFWLEEFAAPYYVMKDAGAELTLASPAGGEPPLDPKSRLPDFLTEATKRFDADEEAQKQLAETHKLSDINPSDYDAVFYPGGHGPLWDLTDNTHSIRLIEHFVATRKPVAAVCHAPAVLLNVKSPNRELLVQGKKVTGFTNSEEEGVQLTKVVPFLLEDALKACGAEFQRGDDWSPFVVTDGLLVTGQNPMSSEATADALLTLLKQTGLTMTKATARHILVENEKVCEDLKREIEEGADFATVARENSSCPSSAQGGDLGEFGPGMMVPEFDKVVFSAPVNTVQGPVKTQFGYHLLEVTSRTDD